jgi:hypothetical protein
MARYAEEVNAIASKIGETFRPLSDEDSRRLRELLEIQRRRIARRHPWAPRGIRKSGVSVVLDRCGSVSFAKSRIPFEKLR